MSYISVGTYEKCYWNALIGKVYEGLKDTFLKSEEVLPVCLIDKKSNTSVYIAIVTPCSFLIPARFGGLCYLLFVGVIFGGVLECFGCPFVCFSFYMIDFFF